MSKWADCCITAVIYNRSRSRIVWALVRADTGRTLGPPQLLSREAVMSVFESGKQVTTALLSKTQPGSFRKGAKVKVVQAGRGRYLSIGPTTMRCDHLGNLPEVQWRASISRRR